MPDLAPIEAEEKALIAEYEARVESEDRELAEWLPPWMLTEFTACDAADRAIIDAAKDAKARVSARRNYLIRRWGEEFKAIVDRDLKAEKRRSVIYPTGKAGYRHSRATVVVTDEAKAIAWCMEHCQEAIDMELKRKTPAAYIIIGMIEAGGECPEGFEYHPAEDRFFPDLGGVSALPPRQEQTDE